MQKIQAKIIKLVYLRGTIVMHDRSLRKSYHTKLKGKPEKALQRFYRWDPLTSCHSLCIFFSNFYQQVQIIYKTTQLLWIFSEVSQSKVASRFFDSHMMTFQFYMGVAIDPTCIHVGRLERT